jgi:hypothetical protein
MAGLARICKAYGGMKVSGRGKTINYVWDYVADKAVDATKMPIGSERWKASERKRCIDLETARPKSGVNS